MSDVLGAYVPTFRAIANGLPEHLRWLLHLTGVPDQYTDDEQVLALILSAGACLIAQSDPSGDEVEFVFDALRVSIGKMVKEASDANG